MASLNKVQIIGNVGNEPEMRFTPSGAPVTSFSVAAGRSYTTNDGERKDETEWFNVVAWQKLAETCNQFLSKGKQVYVEGRQQTRKWEGQDGQMHYKTELIANQVLFLGKKEEVLNENVDDGTAVISEEIDPEDFPL